MSSKRLGWSNLTVNTFLGYAHTKVNTALAQRDKGPRRHRRSRPPVSDLPDLSTFQQAKQRCNNGTTPQGKITKQFHNLKNQNCLQIFSQHARPALMSPKRKPKIAFSHVAEQHLRTNGNRALAIAQTRSHFNKNTQAQAPRVGITPINTLNSRQPSKRHQRKFFQKLNYDQKRDIRNLQNKHR
jgi:hypothetical protein